MSETLEIAVVGHTNAGKTSLLRTLTRRGGFGEVSERPGTTRHVESVDRPFASCGVVRFFDTPGLEDSVALLDYLNALDVDGARVERVRAFLAGPEAHRSFEQEAKVLRTLLAVDAAFYVIDCREPVLPKYRAEIEILAACGKPVMPVLNFMRDADQRSAEWQAALADHGLHAQAQFDAVAPFAGSEQRIYRDLTTLIGQRRALLEGIAAQLELEQRERRSAGLLEIASLLVDASAMRQTLARTTLEQPAEKERALAEFRAGLLQRARRTVDAVLEIHAFRRDEAELALLPWLDGRWEDDLFDAEVLKRAGRQLGTGAAIGATVGAAADVALAGLSLGAATALGAAVGGALSQGFGPVGRTLRNRARGLQDLTLEDATLEALALQMLALQAALEGRGHAAQHAVRVAAPAAAHEARTRPAPLLRALSPARGRPEWCRSASGFPPASAERERVVEDVAGVLHRLVDGAL